jgi:hypothetical protein
MSIQPLDVSESNEVPIQKSERPKRIAQVSEFILLPLASMVVEYEGVESAFLFVVKDSQESFEVPMSWCISGVVKSFYPHFFSMEVPYPLIVVKSMIKYFEHHRGLPPPSICRPLRSRSLLQCCPDPWDVPFIRALTSEDVLHLAELANYLSIPSLLDLCCAQLAIDGKSHWATPDVKSLIGKFEFRPPQSWWDS